MSAMVCAVDATNVARWVVSGMMSLRRRTGPDDDGCDAMKSRRIRVYVAAVERSRRLRLLHQTVTVTVARDG